MKRTTNKATYDIQYHFVWIPKYRKRVLTGVVATRLTQLIQEFAAVNDFEIIELNIQPDHVHLLISAKPRYSPAEIMRLLKGGTSKKIREEYTELEEFLWGDSFWADGYFVSTHSSVTEQIIREYITKQGQDR